MADLTRRSIMGGAAVLPIIAAPALASVRHERTVDRTAWDRAIAEYEATSAAFEAAWEAETTAQARFVDAEKPPEVKRIAGPIPGYDRADGGASYATAFNAHYRRLDRERDEAISRIRAEMGVDAAKEASEKAHERYAAALDAVFTTPAPDLAAVETKLLFIATETDGTPARMYLIADDVRRLAGKGAA